jgi:pimeloyl-ACP methyl ester carboxylesterase
MNHDVFVLLPGIAGSVLQKDGKDIFGLTASAGFQAVFSGGKSIQSLRLPKDASTRTLDIADESPLLPVWDDGVTADRLADDAHLIPGLWKIDGYTKIRRFMCSRFKLDHGQSYHEFAYDWRHDNRFSAQQLAIKARAWLERRREQHPHARLVLVAHSMGGLVARYFLEVLGGWRVTRSLITFGTPYRGSLSAVDYVANGYKKLGGLIDLTDLICSFPSVHQLLTIYPCVDTGASMARITEMPEVLSRLSPAEIAAAREFHRQIEDAVVCNNRDENYRSHGYTIRQVVGTGQPTYQSGRWDGHRLTMMCEYAGEDMSGDGTVARVAASPQEFNDDKDALFSNDKHASLQNAQGVHTQLDCWINQYDLGDFKAIAPVTVSVDAADIHTAGEPIGVRLTPSSATLDIRASLTWVGGPREPVQRSSVVEIPIAEDALELEFSASEPGVYRLSVDGAEIDAISDLVVVAPG